MSTAIVNQCIQSEVSQRELQVLRLIAKGHTSPEIAKVLYLSTHTVMSHRKNLISKLGAKNAAHLVTRGFESGIF